MGYSVISLFVLIIGVYLIFNKSVLKSVMISFLITLILFALLVVKELYVLALAYLVIDSFVKLELFLYFTNKKIVEKPINFTKSQRLKKTFVVIVSSIFIASVFVINRNLIPVAQSDSKPDLELLIVSMIVVIFISSGYIIKSEKWKK